MKSIEILIQEHEVIGKFLYVLEQSLEKVINGDKIKRDFFECALKFIKEYVQKFHHYKEDNVMFELIAQKRSTDLIAQITALQYQHDRGNHQISEMEKSLNGYEKGDPVQTTRLVENLAGFISVLKMHHNWENNIFYPMAQTTITEEEEKKILKAFEKEAKKAHPDITKMCNQLLVKMETGN